jgi:peroxiredoxin
MSKMTVLLGLAAILLTSQSRGDDDWNSLLNRYSSLEKSRLELSRANLERSTYLQELTTKRRASHELATEIISLIKKPDENEVTRYMAIELVLCDRFSGGASHEATRVLLDYKITAAQLSQLCRRIGYSDSGSSPAGETALRKLMDKSEDPQVIGMASLGLARLLRLRINEAAASKHLRSRRELRVAELGGEYVDGLDRMNVDAARSEAMTLLARVEREFTEQESGGVRLGALALQEREYLENQSVGSVARDISGIDTTGTRLALSDFEGRVRVLLFWGQWCVGCRTAYPTYRSLVSKYSPDRFAFLGIDSDKELSTIRQAIDRGDVTWRCWWDGAKDPMKIHSEWKLLGAPHVFVLDAKRRIRFVDVRDEELEEAVESLMND